jgi:hypothetical protein
MPARTRCRQTGPSGGSGSARWPPSGSLTPPTSPYQQPELWLPEAAAVAGDLLGELVNGDGFGESGDEEWFRRALGGFRWRRCAGPGCSLVAGAGANPGRRNGNGIEPAAGRDAIDAMNVDNLIQLALGEVGETGDDQAR